MARGARLIHGRRSRHKLVIEVLDAVSRTRALTDAESEHLEWAIGVEQALAQSTKSTEVRRVPQAQGIACPVSAGA